MKLLVSYPTKAKKWISAVSYQMVYAEAELDAIKILRRPCGTGNAASRYYYQAVFLPPENAEFAWRGIITTNIDRKKNPQFRPKELVWVGNVAEVNAE